MRARCYPAANLAVLVAFILGLSVIPLIAAAQNPGSASRIPGEMLYEGYLTDSEGKPLRDGQYDFTFALYASPKDETPLWEESHKHVRVSDGLLRVHLGKGSPANPLNLPFDQQYFFGIRIGDQPEMVPRLELLTTAYSFRAKVADEVPDGSITNEKLAPLSVTDDKIAGVSWAKIVDPPSFEAGRLEKNTPPPTPSSVWGIRGNLKTDAETNFLGTADYMDLIFRTNNIPRLNITADGEVIAYGCYKSKVDAETGCFLLADSLHGLSRYTNEYGNNVHLFTAGGDILLEGGRVGIGTQEPGGAVHIKSGDGIPALRISSTLTGEDDEISSYPVRIDGADQGIAISLDDASGDNNFVSFWDGHSAVGRIEGQTIKEYAQDKYNAALLTHIGFLAVGVGLAAAPQCPPFAPCPDWEGLIVNGATLAYEIFTYEWRLFEAGVSYSSGSADYAEYLPRIREDEEIEAGDIVGIFGGRATKSTVGAQQILPVSSNPIVLGNTPPQDREHLYEKVAFMGQVGVKVIGPVKTGDFIIPSGLEDGTGVAISPLVMTADEYAKVVGRAWGESDVPSVKLVNVAVGLNPGDVAALAKQQQAELCAIRTQIDELRRQVAALRELGQQVVQLEPAAAR